MIEQAPKIIIPVGRPAMTPEEAAIGHQTQLMEFPTKVHLTVAPNETIMYPAGVHEVPVELASHWYLKAHNVVPYNVPVAVVRAVQKRSPVADATGDKPAA